MGIQVYASIEQRSAKPFNTMAADPAEFKSVIFCVAVSDHIKTICWQIDINYNPLYKK